MAHDKGAIRSRRRDGHRAGHPFGRQVDVNTGDRLAGIP